MTAPIFTTFHGLYRNLRKIREKQKKKLRAFMKQTKCERQRDGRQYWRDVRASTGADRGGGDTPKWRQMRRNSLNHYRGKNFHARVTYLYTYSREIGANLKREINTWLFDRAWSDLGSYYQLVPFRFRSSNNVLSNNRHWYQQKIIVN